MWHYQSKEERPHMPKPKPNHAICRSDRPNALRPAHHPMDRRPLGVLTGDGPELCEAIGAMDARRRRDRTHSGRLSRRLSRCRPLHPTPNPRAVNGWVRQPAPGLQDRGLIPCAKGRAPAPSGRWKACDCDAASPPTPFKGEDPEPSGFELLTGPSPPPC